MLARRASAGRRAAASPASVSCCFSPSRWVRPRAPASSAAPNGGGAEEGVRVSARRGESGRGVRIRVPPLGEGSRQSGMTVWSLADVTRDLERHENVFQELQHAIDYLDHAPAGFFSVEANGDISYLNATLAEWLDHDLAQVGSGGLKLNAIVAGEGAALLTTLAAAPGEVRP